MLGGQKLPVKPLFLPPVGLLTNRSCSELCTLSPYPPSPPGAWLQPRRGPGRGERDRWWEGERQCQ